MFIILFVLLFMLFLLNVITAIFIRTLHEARTQYGYFPSKYGWTREEFARYFLWSWVRTCYTRVGALLPKKAEEEEE